MHCNNLTAAVFGFVALAAAPTALAQSGGAPGAGTIRCESRDGRLRECPIPLGGGVRVAKQLSRTECIRGRNWGVSRDGVWVSDGCRADFAYGYGTEDNVGGRMSNGDRALRRLGEGFLRQCPRLPAPLTADPVASAARPSPRSSG